MFKFIKGLKTKSENMKLEFHVTNKQKIFLLVLIIAFHLVNTACWLNVNDIPMGKDTYSHLYHLSDMIKIVQGERIAMSIDSNHSFMYKFFFAHPEYPPFYYFIGVLLKIIRGWINARVVLFTSSVFFVFLIIFTFKISELIKKNSGILSAFLLSFCPLIYGSMSQFNLELAVCTMVAGSFYFYLKSNDFREKKSSFFSGSV